MSASLNLVKFEEHNWIVPKVQDQIHAWKKKAKLWLLFCQIVLRSVGTRINSHLMHKKRAIGFYNLDSAVLTNVYHCPCGRLTMKHDKISNKCRPTFWSVCSANQNNHETYPTLHFQINWFLWAPFLLLWARNGCQLDLLFYTFSFT